MQPTLYHHHNYHFFIAFVFEMFIGCLLETPSPNYLICLFLTPSITHRTRVLKQNESVQSQHRIFKNVAEQGRERFRKRLQVRSVNRTLCIVCNTILIAHISERNQDSPVYFFVQQVFPFLIVSVSLLCHRCPALAGPQTARPAPAARNKVAAASQSCCTPPQPENWRLLRNGFSSERSPGRKISAVGFSQECKPSTPRRRRPW